MTISHFFYYHCYQGYKLTILSISASKDQWGNVKWLMANENDNSITHYPLSTNQYCFEGPMGNVEMIRWRMMTIPIFHSPYPAN